MKDFCFLVIGFPSFDGLPLGLPVLGKLYLDALPRNGKFLGYKILL